ncbi:MAG: hypothetical protein UT24_C0016G0064 [Candidatus Woesebacteria bacterium GW2011_GWB1_39_12]|uniref:Uncharacterized protein n=1 Tax=Candidatus Woesebacteria bacterium GW2011_GWB1_39_12 TaxID=1618574 RepID=A0A0G0PPT4_9BACT|nr:MAG: hypothetical protein UT24_C0016G0064 [Candidatus Woesebacteria bacterium GW2011_GWB1_39_12]
MLSWQTLNTIYQDETQDTATANVTRGGRYINMVHRNILSYWNWPFMETSGTCSTVASQQAYTFPYNIKRVKSVSVTVSDIVYSLKEISDWDYWTKLNQYGSDYTSNIAEFYFVNDETEIQIFPIPSTAGKTVTIVYEKSVRDLSVDDYTTGTASITITTSKYAITGGSTTWTAAMVGRYFKFDTDDWWYEITSRTSNTVITLKRAFGGASVSGDTYVIGEMPSLPEDFHDLIWLGAVGRYWTLKREDNHAAFYLRQFKDGMEKMKQRYGYKSTGQYISSYRLIGVTDPNNPPPVATQ